MKYPLADINSKFCSIYQIKNLINDKKYIGSSNRTKYRLQEHRDSLRLGTHHSSHLQKAWIKYGEENFVFEIIEKLDIKEVKVFGLLNREQYWMDYYNSYDRQYGYNMSPSALNPNLGIKRSDETKSKLREVWKHRKEAGWKMPEKLTDKMVEGRKQKRRTNGLSEKEKQHLKNLCKYEFIIDQFSLSGEFIRTYSGLSEIRCFYPELCNSIARMLREPKRKHVNGFQWRKGIYVV